MHKRRKKMPPRQAIVAPVWTEEGTRRFGGSAEAFWQRTLAYSPAEVAAFLSKQLQRAPTSPSQTQLAAAGWPGGAFKRTLPRKLPTPEEPTPADTAAWFEWLSERCTLVFDDFSYDGKVLHVELKRGIVQFYVIISYRKTPGAGVWFHELLRVRVKGTHRKPFDGTQGAVWPGPDELQGPNQPADVLYALNEDGREQHAPDLWATPLGELVAAVGPAPHIYLRITHKDGAKVWTVDDDGVVLVKDPARPALYEGYRGDDEGRYTRTWLNRDKIIPVKRSSIGYVPGPLWQRRNAFVLHAYWKRFRKVEDWFKGERLFNYDWTDPRDLLKFHSFLFHSFHSFEPASAEPAESAPAAESAAAAEPASAAPAAEPASAEPASA